MRIEINLPEEIADAIRKKAKLVRHTRKSYIELLCINDVAPPKQIASVNLTEVSLTKNGPAIGFNKLELVDGSKLEAVAPVVNNMLAAEEAILGIGGKKLIRKPTIKRPPDLKGLALAMWESKQKKAGYIII